jgi:hypothetical protein
MSYTSITKMENLHDEALRGLNFYKEDIDILEKRLVEVAAKNSSFEARQDIEHFQNQFVVQQNNIHDLKHKIKIHVHELSVQSSTHGGRVETERLGIEKELADEYQDLEKVINEMRHEFNRFLSKWM